MSQFLLAIDQGTTSSRAIIFSPQGIPISQHQIDLKQYYPKPGWVEQDADEIWINTLECCRNALNKYKLSAKEITALGISNQRETTIIWERNTGKPIYPAIVWQDRRTAELCRHYQSLPISKSIQQKTGLLLDPYFSATKISWILDNVPRARERAEAGELAFGTVDTFLLWRLTNGRSHATDASNASRTLLFNIHTQQWDIDILKAFDIPESLLPEVRDNSSHFGDTDKIYFGQAIRISAMVGDQQAATIGQACFHPGMIKSTFGTGCFMLLNTGKKVIQSKNQLLSTIAYRLNGQVTYGLEGSIFSAGVIVKWFRDTLKIIQHASETEILASSIPTTEGVYLVPAFTGLGAPYWDPEARAALFGLTRNSGREHIIRAGLEAIAYQTRDLFNAMQQDSNMSLDILRVDGGMVANNWLLQFVSDILHLEVQKPRCIETSALGAAYLAGLQAGVYDSLDEIAKHWQANTCFLPHMAMHDAELLYHAWQKVVIRVLTK